MSDIVSNHAGSAGIQFDEAAFGNVSEQVDQFIEKEFPNAQTSVFRDLNMNFRKLMSDSPVSLGDRFLNVVALAHALKFSSLESWAMATSQAAIPKEILQDAQESAAIMGMLNTYYKFKSYLAPEAKDLYQRAGLRMQSLMKPAVGKEKFEMMAFSVSVLNGCPSCVASHERALVQMGVDAEKIHDLARLAAVVKGLSLLYTKV